MHAIKLHLINDGLDVATISLFEEETDAIPKIQIESGAAAGKKKSAILPVQSSTTVTDIIAAFSPKMAATEGEEIVIGYVTDDMFIRSVGGVVEIEWSRDGVIIPEAQGTRYKLRLADVDKKVSAVLRVYVDGRTIAYQTMRPTSPVKLRNVHQKSECQSFQARQWLGRSGWNINF